jgi:hypothetical protein
MNLTRQIILLASTILAGCEISAGPSLNFDESHFPDVQAPLVDAPQPAPEDLDWHKILPPACGSGYAGKSRYYEPDGRSYLYCVPIPGEVQSTDPCQGLPVMVVGIGGIVVCDT